MFVVVFRVSILFIVDDNGVTIQIGQAYIYFLQYQKWGTKIIFKREKKHTQQLKKEYYLENICILYVYEKKRGKKINQYSI